jgi:hypothetical protein
MLRAITSRKTLLLVPCLAILALSFSRASFSQAPGRDRVLEAIDSSARVALRGNVHPLVQAQNDQGPVDDSLVLPNITLVFNLTPSQQSDLNTLLDQQLDPHSPNFHKWLRPEEYAERFGLSPSDLQVVSGWLEAQGFAVTQTARGGGWISFTGTAGQVRSALHTEIHHYLVNGKTYYANSTNPELPSALADVELGFRGLDSYHPHPMNVVRQVAAAPNPNFTSYLSAKNFLAPGDFAIIYDVNALYSSGINGTGQTIAVMGQTDFTMSDITTFRSVSGLPANNPTIVTFGPDPGTGTAAEINEADLDLEWSGAVAPNANIIYVNSNDAFNALQYAIDQTLAPVMTISYGACETGFLPGDSSYLTALETIAQQANSEGITIMSSSGDEGAADCEGSTLTNPIPEATLGLAVDVPAALPNVTAMGGTEFNEGTGTYWLAALNGVDVSPSALSYIPEMAWNDTSATNGLLAGGGGASVFFPKPAWQVGPGVPADGARDVPDLALNASPLHDGYLICSEGSCMNGYRTVSTTPADNNLLTVAGGTSAAAPTFAAIVAMTVEKTGSRQGNISPTLYAMAVSSPSAFHDITVGNNIVPCESGTLDCPTSAPFQYGFSAGPGYDQATGLGSVNAFNLVTQWNASTSANLAAPTLTAPASGATGVALPPTFTWSSVTGNAGYLILVASSASALPASSSVTACASCVISATTSSPTYTPSASALARGTTYYWEVQAVAPAGSGQSAAWSGVSSFTTAVPDFSLAAAPSSVTIAPGASGTSTITLTPINNLSPSSVTFTCTVASALAGVTCTVGSLNASNMATLTINAVTSARNFPAPPRLNRFGGWPLAILGLALLLFLLKLRQTAPESRKLVSRQVVLAVVLAGLLAAIVSCGGGSGGGGGGGTTDGPPESGTVTVQGVGPSTTHIVPITVNIS